MIRFNCDYSEGAHPRILQRLQETNLEQTAGYGEDPYCQQARDLIRNLCQAPKAQVHFLVGGTQANLAVIAAALRPHQGAIAADTGHINIHESGAIEATGHKVLALPNRDGKITAEQVQAYCEAYWADATYEHMVQPKMVYISSPTEVGTLYTREELQALRQVCDRYRMYLFLDGARLGYGLAAQGNDVDLPTLAQCCDAFYLGGTKQGALFGEAVVLTNPALQEDFRYLIKQRGGMLAKGRLLGLQFLTLLEDGLYFALSRHADQLAMEIRRACQEKGYPLLVESTTNQQFPILPDGDLEKLQQKYEFSPWGRVDETHQAVRFCTSWATREEDVQQLVADIRAL